MFDTGSSNLWVPCIQQSGHNMFNCGSSGTCTSTGQSFSIQYGQGQAAGTVMNDIVCVSFVLQLKLVKMKRKERTVSRE
jgi:hypothetical protein